jgi:hypothetical protein
MLPGTAAASRWALGSARVTRAGSGVPPDQFLASSVFAPPKIPPCPLRPPPFDTHTKIIPVLRALIPGSPTGKGKMMPGKTIHLPFFCLIPRGSRFLRFNLTAAVDQPHKEIKDHSARSRTHNGMNHGFR